MMMRVSSFCSAHLKAVKTSLRIGVLSAFEFFGLLYRITAIPGVVSMRTCSSFGGCVCDDMYALLTMFSLAKGIFDVRSAIGTDCGLKRALSIMFDGIR